MSSPLKNSITRTSIQVSHYSSQFKLDSAKFVREKKNSGRYRPTENSFFPYEASEKVWRVDDNGKFSMTIPRRLRYRKWSDSKSEFKRQKRGARNFCLPDFDGIFHVLTLLRKNTSDDSKRALMLTTAAPKSWNPWLDSTLKTLHAACEYSLAPTPKLNAVLAAQIASIPISNSVGQVLAEYLRIWFLNQKASTNDILQGIAEIVASQGFKWLHAIALELIDDKTSRAQAEHLHQELGTTPLRDFIEAMPPWELPLIAIASLVDSHPKTTPADDGEPSDA